MNMRLDQGKQFKMLIGNEFPISMKTACSILILVLLAHVQCGGSCVAETLKHLRPAASEPPCHQHSQNPEKQRPVHQTEGTCSQGPLIESKVFGKRAAMPEIAVFALPTAVQADYSPLLYRLDVPVPLTRPSPPSLSILRI
jgi:hypothetical protein